MFGGTVRGRRVTLRMPLEADLPSYLRWAADMDLRHAHPVWHEPASLGTWRERLEEQGKDRGSILWTIAEGARVIGMCRAELGWEHIVDHMEIGHLIIDPEEQRRGKGWDAALALHRFLFDYHNLRAITATLMADNAAGRRIAERLGYTQYAHGRAVRYRAGGYQDQLGLRLERATWTERWSATEREYEPHPPEAYR